MVPWRIPQTTPSLAPAVAIPLDRAVIPYLHFLSMLPMELHDLSCRSPNDQGYRLQMCQFDDSDASDDLHEIFDLLEIELLDFEI